MASLCDHIIASLIGEIDDNASAGLLGVQSFHMIGLDFSRVSLVKLDPLALLIGHLLEINLRSITLIMLARFKSMQIYLILIIIVTV